MRSIASFSKGLETSVNGDAPTWKQKPILRLCYPPNTSVVWGGFFLFVCFILCQVVGCVFGVFFVCTHVCVWWCFENKWCKGNHSPSSMGRPEEKKWLASSDPFSPFSLLCMSSYGMEYLWFVRVIYLFVFTPNPLHTPSCGVQWETEAALALWKCHLAIARTSVCCQPCFGCQI